MIGYGKSEVIYWIFDRTNTKIFTSRDVKFKEDSVINCSDCEIEIIEDKSLEEQSVNEKVDEHVEENDDDEVIEHDDKVEIDQDEIVVNELNKEIYEQNDLNKNKNQNQIEQQ
jgi:hypothetical protein